MNEGRPTLTGRDLEEHARASAIAAAEILIRHAQWSEDMRIVQCDITRQIMDRWLTCEAGRVAGTEQDRREFIALGWHAYEERIAEAERLAKLLPAGTELNHADAVRH